MVRRTIETKQYSFASDRQFSSPSIFLNPTTGPQMNLLLDFLQRYDVEDVGGIVIDVEDWDTVGEAMQDYQSAIDAYNSNSDRQLDDFPLIINPDFSPIMGYGGERVVGKFSKSVFLPSEAKSVTQDLLDEDNDKLDVREEKVYPMIQNTKVIRDTMTFQSDKGADVVAPPTVPLRTKRDFDSRIRVAKDILDTGSALSEGGLFPSDCSLMHIISLKPSVFDMPEGSSSPTKRWDQLIDIATDNEPDVFGIHLCDIDLEDSTQNQNLLNAIERIKNELEVPVILLNVREFGLATFLYGVDAFAAPIAADPHPFFGGQEGPPPTQLGSYYHPEHMIDLSREELRNEIRDNEYRFPCHCEICEDREFFHNVSEDEWNDFRRIHYMLAKNREVRQLRDSDKLHSAALQGKLENSQLGKLLPYLPN